MDYKDLLEQAKQASELSYSPYSNFPVGACVLTEAGNTYKGANIENASYGLTVCAERNAIATAVLHGEKKIKAVAIFGQKMKECYPCGMCRQVIHEFRSNDGVDVIVEAQDGSAEVISIDELLPKGFDL